MKSKEFAWIFFALMISSAVVSAQGWRNGRCAGYNLNNDQQMCLNVLTDITDEQKEKIMDLGTVHQETMDELRVKQRSTHDRIKKNELREEMLQKVQAHRNEVRNLLTEEQQEQYDLLHTSTGNRGRGFAANSKGGRGQAGYGRGGFRGGW